jgi:hypothetical protein
MSEIKAWAQTKSQEELDEFAKKRAKLGLCMFVEANADGWQFCANSCEFLLCEEHCNKLDDTVLKIRDFLKNDLEKMYERMKKIPVSTVEYDTPRYFRDIHISNTIYRATSEKQLIRVYVRDSVLPYKKNDPEEFLDQYAYELITWDTTGQEHTFYEIPTENIEALFISHVKRRVKEEYMELTVEDLDGIY